MWTIHVQCKYMWSTHRPTIITWVKNIAIFIVEDSEQISQWFISVFEVIWQILILLALRMFESAKLWFIQACWLGLGAWWLKYQFILHFLMWFTVQWSSSECMTLSWNEGGWKSDAKWYRAHWYFGLYVQIIRLKYNVYSFSGLNIVYLCTFLIC